MAKKKDTVLDGMSVNDGWTNVLTGLGDVMKDKRMSGAPATIQMDYTTTAELYRGSDLAARIVDVPVNDVLREGLEVRIPDEEDLTEELGAYWEDHEADDALIKALKFSRAYGGSIVLVGANDGSADLSKPLNENNIKTIDYLNVFDAYEAQVEAMETNPLKKGYGRPTMFRINPHLGSGLSTLQKVHASRCLVFSGPIVNHKQLLSTRSGVSWGWGDSVLIRCAELIRDYDAAWGGVSNLLHDFAQSVYKIKGLGAALLADKDKTIKKRWHLINMARSIINATLIDKDDEEFTRDTVSMAGVPETLKEFQARLSACAGMPITKLFGTSSGGLGSTGEAEDRTWYDYVRNLQKRELKAQANRLTRLCMLAKDAPTKGKEPENWNVCFHPLWQESNMEKADIRLKNAQTDQIYHGLGVASSEDIANSRYGGDEYGMDLVIDLDALEEREAQAQEMADVEHEVTKSNLEEHGQPTPPKATPKPGEPK